MDASDLSRPARRLLSELADDGVVIDADDQLLPIVLDELEHARRPQQFERRTPLYGSMIVPADRSLVEAGELVDLIPLDGLSIDEARRFADGRSVFVAVQHDGTRTLACFRRSVQYEADMVEIQADTGAFIVQRTPVLGVTRLFTVVRHDRVDGLPVDVPPERPEPSTSCSSRTCRPSPRRSSAACSSWPSTGSARGGSGRHSSCRSRTATRASTSSHAIATPDLSVTARHHYPALLAALMQTDLATVVDAAGRPHHIGVGLHWSDPRPSRRSTVNGGMRHRSAARYTYDHSEAVAIVVSEDGPVTVFHHGKPLSQCAASLAMAAAGDPA